MQTQTISRLFFKEFVKVNVRPDDGDSKEVSWRDVPKFTYSRWQTFDKAKQRFIFFFIGISLEIVRLGTLCRTESSIPSRLDLKQMSGPTQTEVLAFKSLLDRPGTAGDPPSVCPTVQTVWWCTPECSRGWEIRPDRQLWQWIVSECKLPEP